MALHTCARSPRFTSLPRLSTTALAIAAGLAVSGSASAQITWDNAAGGLWQLDANWDTLSQPNAPTDNVVILNPVTAAVPVVVTVGPNLTRDAGTLTINDTGVAAKHQLVVANNTFLDISGDVSNNGVISVLAGANATRYRVQASHTLSGPGELLLATTGAGSAEITGAAGNQVLTNVAGHTISGAGNIGGNTTSVANAGLIDANLTGQTLVFDPDAGVASFTNTGTYRASNGGTLLLTGAFGGDFDSTGGTIEAVGAGSEVQFTAAANLVGGTVRGTGGGVVRINAGQTIDFDSIDFTDGTLEVDNNASFQVEGSFTNNATVNLNAAANAADFGIVGDVTLDGGGTINLNQSAAGLPTVSDNGGIGVNTLTNVDNTLRGSGNIGGNSMGLINQAGGLILADDNGGTLTLDPANAIGFSNLGTYRAANGGTLQLTGAFGGDFDSTGGVIEAVGAGSEVQFTAAANLVGGTVRGTGGGVVRINAGQTIDFDSIDFTAGTIEVDNNASFQVEGSFTNNATVNLNAAANAADFGIVGDVTLDGGGTINLNQTAVGLPTVSDNGGSGVNTLTNVDNTIRGSGNIGGNSMGLINQAGGLILADDNGGTLTLDPAAGVASFTNLGTYRAANGGTLQLIGAFGGDFDSTGGTIEAVGAGSEVQFTAAANLVGGTVRGTGGGVVRINASQTIDFNGVDFTDGSLEVDNNASFQVEGSFTNNATVNLNAGVNAADFGIVGDVTLDGGGTINLNQSAAGLPTISDNGGSGVNRLTNVDNTIQGGGNLGANSLKFTNSAGGQLIANDAANALLIDPGNSEGNQAFVNQGLLRATNNATLNLSGSFSGGFTNAAGGTIDIDAGSTVNLTGTLIHQQGAAIDQAGVLNINSGGELVNEADDYSPGASPGIVNVNGSGRFTNDTNGTVTFELNGDGTPGVDFDTIRGAGNFDLAGTLDLDLNFSPTFYESIELILDTAGRNVNGTFEQLGFAPIVAPGDALAITYRENNFGQVDAVLLTRALPGDANLDGFISQGDLDAVLLNWGSSTSTWQTGEMSGDDFVSQADLDLVLLNWGTGTPPVVDLSLIPEPTSLTLCGLAGLALVARRRRV